MIKNILVCLEGSASAAATTLTGVETAHERNASLTGIAILDKPDIEAGALGGIGGSSFKHERDLALLADARTHADEWLAVFNDRYTSASVQARTLEVVGKPSEIILDEMERHALALIGRDANFRFETNSDDRATRKKILRHASHPILLVPDRAEPSSFRLGPTVLVAYDGGPVAQRALASFAASGLAESRTIHVATVDDDGAKAGEMANLAVERLRADGIQATGHGIVSTLSNAESLAKFGQDIGAGMVAMGAFARSRMAELFGSSATRDLTEHSQTPLYLQR